VLCRRLGPDTGAKLWAHAHGRDDRKVERPPPRKSVGAEVNWGVRFSADEDAHKFLRVGDGEERGLAPKGSMGVAGGLSGGGWGRGGASGVEACRSQPMRDCERAVSGAPTRPNWGKRIP
jgi:hypothetical protein